MRKTVEILSYVGLAAVMLSGCAAVSPQYREPAPELPARFADSSSPSDQPASPSAWWEAFGDAELNRLVAQALDANRELRASVARVEAARARRGAAAQDYLPSGGPAAGYQRGERPALEGGARHEAYRAAFDTRWELDLFGRVGSRVRAADARLGAAQAGLADFRLTVAAEVARTYFEWRGSQQRLRLLQGFNADQSTIVDLTAVRLEGGEAAAEDLSRARAQLASDRATLLAEQDRERRLRHALAVLVGAAPGTWSAPAEQALEPVSPREIAIGDPASLIRRRPDVRAAERRLAATVADIGVATAGLFPQVSISGFFGFVAGDRADLGDADSRSWLLAPTLSWGLFDLGRVRAGIRASESESRAVLAEYEQAVLRALEDAENAFGGYGIAQQRLAAVLEQARESRRAADISRARYEEGEADYLSALDAARGARAAEASLVDALVAQRTATLAVHKALGAMPAATTLAGG